MKQRWPKLLIALFLLLPLLACGGESNADPIPTEGVIEPTVPVAIEIEQATFAHGLDEQMQPLNPGNTFDPTETVYLSMQLKGRPRGGIVIAQFYWHDNFIAEASVDLSDLNSGVIFSVGESTYAGFTLTHDQPFPISDAYQARISYDGQLVDVYAFGIVPPSEAIPTNVKQVSLALGVDEGYYPLDETSVFTPDESVHLVGRGDLGLLTWFQAEWYVSGELDEAGTRSFTLEENVPDVGFYFSYQPEEGWPPGEHMVILTMNDEVIGQYPFLIIASGGAVPLDETAFWEAFPLTEDAELIPVVEGIDLAFTTDLSEPQVFDLYAAWLRQQGWQRQAPIEAVVPPYPYQRWLKEDFEFMIEVQGQDEAGRTVVAVRLVQGDTP